MLLFETFLERGGNRAGPIFSTSDRALAWEFASVAERAIQWSGGSGDVVMTISDGDCILNEVADGEKKKFPPIRSVQSFYNWKAKGFDGLTIDTPLDEVEIGDE